MKKRRDTLITLLLVLAILVVGYFGLQAYLNRDGGGETQDMSVPLFQAESFTDIAYTYEGDWLRFSWNEETRSWYYTEDPVFPLKSAGLSSIVLRLKNFTALRLVEEEAQELSVFGLDGQTIRVEAKTGDGRVLSFRIGGQNPATGDYYMQVDGTDAVYLLARAAGEYFTLGIQNRATLDTLPDVKVADVSEFIYTGPDGAQLHFVYLENGASSCYTDQYQWFWKQEDGALAPLHQTAVKSLLNEALQLSFEECLTYGATEEQEEALGLGEQPLYQMTVHYTATHEEQPDDPGKEPVTWTSQETLVISIGLPQGREYLCARFGDSQMIGLVKGTEAGALLQVDLGIYYPRDVCLIKPQELNAFSVQAGALGQRIVIDGVGEEAQYTLDGSGRAADKTAVERFLGTLLGLQAESTAPEDPGTAAALAVTFERDRPGFKRMTIELVPYDSNFYLVRFDERSDLLVNRRSVETLLGLTEQF